MAKDLTINSDLKENYNTKTTRVLAKIRPKVGLIAVALLIGC